VGFLQAVYSLGTVASKRNEDSPLADISNFLQLPYPLTEVGSSDNRAKNSSIVYVIRVWLEATEPSSDVLDIRGISKIDRIEYGAIGSGENEIKERCLYRDPVGSNVSWRFSPLHKLGKGGKNLLEDLLGKKGDWTKDDKCTFYKIYSRVLKDYEDSGYFSIDSAKRVMADLAANVDRIVEYLSDKKNPHFLLFGLKQGEIFLYPGEIPAFVEYFRSKLNPDTDSESQAESRPNKSAYCALCGKSECKQVTLDRVFKFATFDKPGFLPGTKDGAGIREKVFPVCEDCYEILSAGKEEMERRFVNDTVIPIPNHLLYVIPEVVFDQTEYLQRASRYTKDFLIKGIRNEVNLFNSLARHEEGLVYHFLFAEINQAQLIIHSFIEDVPPTHLKQLEQSWIKTCHAFSGDSDSEQSGRYSLDIAFKQIFAVLMSMAGKREQEQKVMKEKAIAIVSALLNGERVETSELKTLIVSRLAGLFTDPDWLKPKGKNSIPGRLKIIGMAEVMDFLGRANKEDNYESGLVGKVC